MTDHSILRPSIPDFPFKDEARFIGGVFTALFVKLPRTFARALRAQQIYDTLYTLDSPGLAALGIPGREGIGRYAIERSGLLERDAR